MNAPTLQEKYAHKIAAILAKAEDKSVTAEEAQTFFEQAQRLMSKYAIEQAMIDKWRGTADEEIIERHIEYLGIYHAARFDIGAAIAEAQDTKHLISKSAKSTTLFIVGFQSDVERAIFLDSKVQIQALAAQTRWAASQDFTGKTAMQKFKDRREFLFGYARGLAVKLDRAKQAGREDARTELIAAGKGEDEVSSGMALALRSRKDRIDEWYKAKYGGTKQVTLRASRGSNTAYGAGQQAGQNADVGSAGSLRQQPTLPEGSVA